MVPHPERKSMYAVGTQISPIDREKERVWIVLGATGLHLHFNSLKVIFWLKGLTGSKLQLLFGWLVAIS